jgi:hypothetical protein
MLIASAGAFAAVDLTASLFPCVVPCINDIASIIGLNPVDLVGGTSIAMAYAFVSVPKTGINPGTPQPKKDRIILIRTKDILSYPAADASGVLVTGNITLKAGKEAVYIYCTPGTVDISTTTEGDPDNRGFKATVVFEHPGKVLKFKEFLVNNINENLVAIYEQCDNTKELIGTLCNPIQFDIESYDNKDKVGSKLTLKQLIKTDKLPYTYSGLIPELDDSGSWD